MTVNASVKEIQQEMESSVEVRNSPWKDCVLAFSGTYLLQHITEFMQRVTSVTEL